MDRTILHLDLDSFFVSVERLINPALEHVPVVVGGLSDRGVVSSSQTRTLYIGSPPVLSIPENPFRYNDRFH